jgi:ribose transport system permease protein
MDICKNPIVSGKERITTLLKNRNMSLIILIAAIWGIASILSPFFMTTRNILTLLFQSSTVAIMGIGMTFVIIAGGIDASVGSIVAFTSMVLGILITKMGVALPWAIIACLGIGLLAGFVNGIIISKFNLQPIIVTLGTSSIFRGLTYILTEGRPIFVIEPTLLKIGGGKLGPIPIPVLIALGCFFIGYVVLEQTKFGIYVFAVGGNKNAAHLSGINVKNIQTKVYMICSFFASLAGVLLVGLLGASEPSAGIGLELTVVAVVAIGGASMLGGSGDLVGTMLGAILIGTLQNAMNLTNVISYYQNVLIGVIIISAVLFDQLQMTTRKKRRKTNVLKSDGENNLS